jgi:hypothetical protein
MNARVRSRPTSRASSRVSSFSESPLVGDANASPTPAVSTVWRSGRSSMRQESRKATKTIAAATRKTVESASVNAPV